MLWVKLLDALDIAIVFSDPAVHDHPPETDAVDARGMVVRPKDLADIDALPTTSTLLADALTPMVLVPSELCATTVVPDAIRVVVLELYAGTVPL